MKREKRRDPIGSWFLSKSFLQWPFLLMMFLFICGVFSCCVQGDWFGSFCCLIGVAFFWVIQNALQGSLETASGSYAADAAIGAAIIYGITKSHTGRDKK